MNPDYVIPAHCSGEQFYDIARVEMPGHIVRSVAGSASELPDVLSWRGSRPFFCFPDFDGFRLGCRRSALALVFDGIERPVSGSRDLLLDGMVGSTASQKVDLSQWRLWPDGTPERRGSFRFEAVTRHGRNDDYLR
jgi:hypothetical protein